MRLFDLGESVSQKATSRSFGPTSNESCFVNSTELVGCCHAAFGVLIRAAPELCPTRRPPTQYRAGICQSPQIQPAVRSMARWLLPWTSPHTTISERRAHFAHLIRSTISIFAARSPL